MRSVHLTDRAMLDIDEIERYSVSTWGERVAARDLDDLGSAFAMLGDSPNLLQERTDISLRLRFYAVREHVVICDVIGDRIFVLAVRHRVMDLPHRIAEVEPLLILESEVLASRIARHNSPENGA